MGGRRGFCYCFLSGSVLNTDSRQQVQVDHRNQKNMRWLRTWAAIPLEVILGGSGGLSEGAYILRYGNPSYLHL